MEKKTIGETYLEKFPDKIPVVIYFDGNVKKILISKETKFSFLLSSLVRKYHMPFNKIISGTIKNYKPSPTETLGVLHSQFRQTDDDCLHINIHFS